MRRANRLTPSLSQPLLAKHLLHLLHGHLLPQSLSVRFLIYIGCTMQKTVLPNSTLRWKFELTMANLKFTRLRTTLLTMTRTKIRTRPSITKLTRAIMRMALRLNGVFVPRVLHYSMAIGLSSVLSTSMRLRHCL